VVREHEQGREQGEHAEEVEEGPVPHPGRECYGAGRENAIASPYTTPPIHRTHGLT
jgi:hypothetical protein